VSTIGSARLQRLVWSGGAAALGVFLAAHLAARLIGFGEPPLVHLDPLIEYYPIPNRSYRRFGHLVAINRYGMRSDDFDRITLPREDHVLLLGDSVVYGNHHIDQSSTVAARLQHELRAQPHRHLLVVSALAASSWGPGNVLEHYRRFGPFPGRAAYVVVSTHDRVDAPHVGTDLIPYRVAPPLGPLHDLWLSVWERLKRRLATELPGPSHEELQRRVDAALAELLVTLRVNHDDVTLLFHPTRSETKLADTAGQEHFRVRAGAQGVRFVSLMPVYRRAYQDGIEVHADDIHLSDDGSRVVAKHIQEGLAPRLGTTPVRP
jgi:hypothetical protein